MSLRQGPNRENSEVKTDAQAGLSLKDKLKMFNQASQETPKKEEQKRPVSPTRKPIVFSPAVNNTAPKAAAPKMVSPQVEVKQDQFSGKSFKDNIKAFQDAAKVEEFNARSEKDKFTTQKQVAGGRYPQPKSQVHNATSSMFAPDTQGDAGLVTSDANRSLLGGHSLGLFGASQRLDEVKQNLRADQLQDLRVKEEAEALARFEQQKKEEEESLAYIKRMGWDK